MNDIYGTDIASADGDYLPTAQGDVATVSGPDNLQQALERRWGTPLGALFYDSTYGNPVYAIMSQPINADWIDRATDAAKTCILGDPRVSDVQVTVTPNPLKRKVLFSMQWTGQDGATGTLTQEVPAGV